MGSRNSKKQKVTLKKFYKTPIELERGATVFHDENGNPVITITNYIHGEKFKERYHSFDEYLAAHGKKES